MKTRKLIPLLIAGIGLLIYHNSLRVGFLLDDQSHITENSRIRHLWPLWDIMIHTSRPVVLLSAAMNYAVGGLTPWGYHLFNVAVHILAALALFGVARRTFLSEPLRSRFGEAADKLAAMISLIWLVHPLQTEAVTYTIQRGESLMALFYLLTLYYVIRSAGASRGNRWSMAAVACCALGMASKPIMVTAPVVILLYDRAYLSKSWREIIQRHWLLYGCLAATWLLLPWLLANGSTEWKDSAGFAYNGVPPLRYALTQSGVILHYLRLAFWPRPLCFDYCCAYGWPVAQSVRDVAPGLVAVGALLAGTLWAWWRNPPLGFLGVWFFLILAPTSSFLPVADLVVEHRMYLPLAAVVAAVTVGAFVLGQSLLSARPQARRIIAGAMVAILVLLLAIATVQRNRDYRSDMALWEDTLAKCPNNPRAHNNLGVDLLEQGSVPEAMDHYQQALRIKPDYADAQYNLGLALVQLGRLPEAIRHFEQAVQIQPDHVRAHNDLGVVLLRLGRPQDAVGHFEEMLRIKPDYAEAHGNLAIALMQLGRTTEALGHFEQTVRLRPADAQSHNNLGLALLQVGKKPEAIAQFEQALRLNPDLTQAQTALARLQSHQ